MFYDRAMKQHDTYKKQPGGLPNRNKPNGMKILQDYAVKAVRAQGSIWIEAKFINCN